MQQIDNSQNFENQLPMFNKPIKLSDNAYLSNPQPSSTNCIK